MFEVMENLMLFFAEGVLVLSALFLLLIGAFRKNFDVILYGAILAMCVALFLVVSLSPEQSYGFNKMLETNGFVQYSKVLILISSIMILLIATSSKVSLELPILILLSTSGMMILVSAFNLMTLYLGLELMSLPLYILAAFNRDNSKSTEAGMKYFIMGAVASGLFLMGTTLVYGFTGSINFTAVYDYYLNISADGDSVAMPIGFLVGLVFIIAAFAFKISAVPFHMWTPDVYEGAPTLFTAFFASAPKVAGFAILVKVLMDPFAELYIQWQQIILFVSIASMLVGSLGAIMQKNFKRLLAYSSIGHVGFALAGLVTAEIEGVKGVLIYLSIYLTMTVGAFGIIMLLRKDGKSITKIADFAGLAKSCPNAALAMTVFVMSMAGIPPLAGFFAKYFILLPLMRAEMYITAVVFVISSVIAAFYYLNIVKLMYFDSHEGQTKASGNLAFRFVICICVLFNVGFLLSPTSIIVLAEKASGALSKQSQVE